MASSAGNQIFINLKKSQKEGLNNPPKTVDVRVKYEQTVGDLRRLVAKKAGLELAQLQLFWHGKELLAEKHDSKTLLEMDLHTGFSLMAYDLSQGPIPLDGYWPPVRKTPEGLVVIPASEIKAKP